MIELQHHEADFLHACARSGPTNLAIGLGETLESRGLVKFVFEGNSLQGKWRLTHQGRAALEAFNRAQ